MLDQGNDGYYVEEDGSVHAKPEMVEMFSTIIKETTTNVVGKKDAAKAATLSRKESFYQLLVPYVGQYPKEMIRAFFDYWSELNKSETKMRYELEKTWELPRRLATWASREKVPSKTDVGIVLKDNSPEKYKKGW